MPDPILRAERFGYRYPGAPRDALADLTLALEPGSFTLVVGESGSGKSTLLRAACGLVPHFHGGDVRGEFEVAGMGLREHGPNDLAASCATLLQDPETQVVMSGVRAELALPLEQRGHEAAAIARAVEETSLELGVAHLLDRRTETLSGGELQRVALAAAVAGKPALLVLDEPTSQLDPVAGDDLVWLLRRLNEEWGTAVLLAEHRLERCLAAADRVLAMDGGRVAFDAEPDEFLEWAAERHPVLATPAARLFSLAGIGPPPVSVKEARDRLERAGLAPAAGIEAGSALQRPPTRPALRLEGVWHELADGPAILRGIDLELRQGGFVALMGRNGAGKSTLLRHAKGLVDPTRGRVIRDGGVALLLQNPGDFLIHEHVRDEAGPAAIERAGLGGREADHPRDLSGGERQRLALEIVLEAGDVAVVCLDEPTRGMDRGRKEALGRRLRELAERGLAVVVATHDTEFVASWAERVVLMGPGTVIADGSTSSVLAGGRHFATDVARILDGAGGALTPEAGAQLLEREARAVTWQLASFAILALGLAAGFAWYERSRPSARVLALVAALAALAVVGRLAFAAFPNVKPTTDIVLLAGYALGGAPGFAVGAITPVVSNVFMGHGPWTPWQMAAWGGVGIGGAMLARVTRGREQLGRWPLAAACAVAGVGFGVVMDTYQWTLAAHQDAATWIAVSGSSLPYNLAHVVGNVIFCLLIGPGLLRALSRYRRRFEVRWAPATAAATGAVLLALALPVGASAASAGKRATTWLVNAQNKDGGFGSARGQASGALYTGWASLGVAAGGRNPRDVERRGHSPIDFIRTHAGEIGDVGEVERTILVIESAGLSARNFAGRDFVARLERYRRANGSFSGFVSYTAFGILALRAAGSNAVGEPADWLADQQNDDGGFGLSPGAQSDVDNTGAALQALAAAGRRGPLDEAIGYLRHAQNGDGGFGQYDGRSSNAQSTAYAVQGLVAAGRNPGRFRKSGRSPVAYLRSLQRADGSVDYSRASSQTPVWVAAQAVMALKRKPLPLDPVPRQAAASPTTREPASSAPAASGRREARKPRETEREEARKEARREPGAVRSAQASEPPTPYAPLDEPGADPAAAERRSEPSWPGAAITLVAAALAGYGGRRLRPANVATKRSATAA